MSKGGIILANPDAKGVTVFVLVDAIGPDVKRCKVGDIVVPKHMSHIYLRGGQNHRVVFADEVVLIAIEDLPRDQFTIEGEEQNGSTQSESVVTGAPV